jgi:tRNA(Ile)-lysidine synthase
MIHLSCKIPNDVTLAVSGGPDSMALLDFCIRGKKSVRVVHVDHGTDISRQSRELVLGFCRDAKVPITIRRLDDDIDPTEEGWRNGRLLVYKEFTRDGWVATAHHLDDVVEWYLMTALHGKTAFMRPVDSHHRLLKPLLKTPKGRLLDWCLAHDVPFVTDPTNVGTSNARAILRAEVIPSLLKIHPGFRTSILNKMPCENTA